LTAELDSAAATARRKDRVLGLVILALAFSACLLLSWWCSERVEPEVSQPPAPPTTAGVAGFPNRVDPLAALALARTLTPRPLLRGIVAEGVSSDGTVDVQKVMGTVRYLFQSPQGKGPQPPREPGTLARRPHCGRQYVRITRLGIGADDDIPSASCPAPEFVSELPAPTCGPRELWQKALAAGASRDHAARIEYYLAKAGPAWRFSVPAAAINLYFSGDCSRALNEGDAAPARLDTPSREMRPAH
jgi:hypothetical protein